MRMVTTMKAKCSYMKGSVLFEIHVSSEKDKDVSDDKLLNKYHVFQ